MPKIDLNFDNTNEAAFSYVTVERLSQNKHCSDQNEIKEGIKPVNLLHGKNNMLMSKEKIFISESKLSKPTELSPRYSGQ